MIRKKKLVIKIVNFTIFTWGVIFFILIGQMVCYHEYYSIPWAAARPQVVCQQQTQYTVSSEHSSCQSGYTVGLLSGTGSRELARVHKSANKV